jgi:hypothetical protein
MDMSGTAGEEATTRSSCGCDCLVVMGSASERHVEYKYKVIWFTVSVLRVLV